MEGNLSLKSTDCSQLYNMKTTPEGAAIIKG